ncbi:MAG: type III polyketide synthase [Candidatus Glassbacteria bacterium]
MTRINNAPRPVAPDKAIRIAALATASPPFKIGQKDAEAFLKLHYAKKFGSRNQAIMRQVFHHPSIAERHFAFEDPLCLIDEEPDERMERFTGWAVRLSAEALNCALDRAGVAAEALGGLVINTCTGYICPGISTYLFEKIGLSRDIPAYDLVGSGCGGAIPNLQIAENLLRASGTEAVACVSVEICSATFQMEDEPSLIVSNALFGDGAAAAVLWKRPRGLALRATASRFLPEYRESIRYIYKNGKLHNQLAPDLPQVVSRPVGEIVREFLRQEGLQVEDIQHWAIHPGGDKVISAIQKELGLSDRNLEATRLVLKNYGNMSSATVWFILREILDRGTAPGERVMLLAFGAGLSIHVYLLQA